MSIGPLSNSIETYFEITVTPEQLFEIANKLEHGAKIAHPGQVIRVKMDSQFCFIYRPNFNSKVFENTLTGKEENKTVK